MADESTKLIERLDDLLEIEREALIAGNVQKLTEIVDEKEELIEQLSRMELDQGEGVDGINDKVRRNQLLLGKALEGIRSVAGKLADIRRHRREFDTYNQLGQRNRIEGDKDTSVEKRA